MQQYELLHAPWTVVVISPRRTGHLLQIVDPKEAQPLYSSFSNDRIFRDPLMNPDRADVRVPVCPQCVDRRGLSVVLSTTCMRVL